VTALWRVVLAFYRRDMQVAISYKTGFALGSLAALGNILGVLFLSKAFGAADVSSLDRYGGSYFSFALVGVAFTNFMAIGIGGLGARIREGQLMGTLELMLISPNRLGLILLSSSVWSHVSALLAVFAYLVVGAVLGMPLDHVNLPVAGISVVLAIVSFNALGLLAASVVIVIKQGNPVNWVVSTASVILAGVFYPRSVLPEWLQTAGEILPLTHALELLRRSMLLGEGLGTLWPSMLALAGITAVMLPLGLFACHVAVRMAQTDGSLSHY
jgi:ABC-2 type transport system permease protein